MGTTSTLTLELDCFVALDELAGASTDEDAGATSDDESSKGAMSPESGMGSSKELLTGIAEELLTRSDEEEMSGIPAEIGGSFELLLIFAAEERASIAELLRAS